MKKQVVRIGFLILVVASSLSAQSRSSSSQVVTFGIKNSSARLVAGVLAASMTSSLAGLKETSELQIPASQLKKITYRFNGSTTSFSEIPTASRTSPRHRSVANLRGANDLVITITD